MEVINMSGDNSVRYDTKSVDHMHKAAKEGDLEELQRLLLAGEDPTNLDGKNRSPLHWACGFAVQNTTLEMVEAILESPKVKAQSDTEQKLVNYKDDFGNTALHEAARRGHGLVIKKLLFSGANPSLKNEEKHSALHEVFKKKPTAMIPTYNEAVTTLDKTDTELEKSPENKDAKSLTGNQTQRPSWTIDFLGLVGSIDKSSASFEFLRPETEWLSICLELSDTKQSQLFMHPVVRTFLHLKWKKIRILLWLSVLYHILWLILYTYFNVDLYLMHCPFAVPAEENDTDYEMTTTDLITEDPPPTEDYYDQDIKSMGVKSALDITGVITYCDLWDHYTRLNTELWLLFWMTVTISVKEVYELYSSREKLYYFKQLENIGQWIVVGIVLLASIPIFRVDDNWGVGIYEWQYQASAFGVLLACSLTLNQIGKIPRFGIYILILAEVVKSFVMFMITFATILMAFMISFQILMPEKEQFKDNPWGFIRVLVMMTGEINYDDLFHSEDGNFQLPFPISTKFLFAAFIAIVTIILFNLLIGLTVSDIQGLQKGAELNSVSIQVEEIHYMEKFLSSHTFQKLLNFIGVHHWLQRFRVTRINENVNTKVDVCKNQVPKEFHSELKSLASKSKDENEDTTSSTIITTALVVKNKIQKVKKLKQQLNEMLQEFLDEVEQKNSKA